MTTYWVNEKDLDASQTALIEGLDDDASFVISGPAGSGKTNLLLLRAKRLILNGLGHLKIIVFTATLRRFVQIGCEQYKIPPDTAITSTRLFIDLLREYGVEVNTSGNFEDDRIMLAGKVKSLIESKGISNIFDALLVDESQDYSDTELQVFRQLTQRLVLVTDIRQSIYRTTHSDGFAEKLVGGDVRPLKFHYRSGLKLCRVADAILRDSKNFTPVQPECNYDENVRPSSVTLSQQVDFSAQIKSILDTLPGQLDLYPKELIGVLFPKRDQQRAFSEALLKEGEKLDSTRVVVETLHGSKGLEFRAVHIAGLEELPKMGPAQKRLVYTGILRGRTAAALHFSGNVPGYIESAMAQLAPPKPKSSVKDLFK